MSDHPAAPSKPAHKPHEPAAVAPDRRRWVHRLGVLGLWAGVFIAAQVAIGRSGKGTVEAVSDAVEAARGAWWSVPAFLATYAARSLVLFPASLLTVAAGVLFGAWLGVPLALLGAVISAAISYELARTVGPTEATLNRPPVGAWAHRIQEAGFPTVLTMRLVMMPFDPVNLLAGGLRIPRRAFLAGTAIGTVPGVTAFALAGASVGRVDAGFGDLSVPTLATAGAVFAFSIALAAVVSRRAGAAHKQRSAWAAQRRRHAEASGRPDDAEPAPDRPT
ncbi:MAG: VTT domain-containing protein [Microthrixaceae bacterium]